MENRFTPTPLHRNVEGGMIFFPLYVLGRPWSGRRTRGDYGVRRFSAFIELYIFLQIY
jgi:hypothetical protein